MTARALTKALRGQWHGSYGTARCPAHDDRHPSLSVTERDGKLLAHCHAGCDQGAVWDVLTGQGLVGHVDQDRSSRQREISTCAPRAPDTKDAAARRIWSASQPTAGSPVEIYLASRGIMISPPSTLRYHSALKHGPTGLLLPAMVAAVAAWPSREVTAIHRTYLLPDGRGKAQVRDPKMALGPFGDGAVRLGRAGRQVLGLAEGIETALSAQQLFELPVWAVLGSRFDRVAIPADVIELQVFADNGEPGQEAAAKARDAFTKAGLRVAIRRPPEGFGDWNDASPHWHERPADDWEF